MQYVYIGKEKGARQFKAAHEKKLGGKVRLFHHAESNCWVAISSTMVEVQEEQASTMPQAAAAASKEG